MYTPPVDLHKVMLLAIVLLSYPTRAQKTTTLPADSAREYLRTGTLILALPSHIRTIHYLDSLAATADHPSQRKRIEKLKSHYSYLQKSNLRDFAATIVKHWPFHRILLAWDTALYQLKSPGTYPCFIDTLGKPLPQQAITTQTIIAYPGISAEQKLEVFQFRTLDGASIAKPFPSYIMRQHIMDRLKAVFSRKKTSYHAAQRFVDKLKKFAYTH